MIRLRFQGYRRKSALPFLHEGSLEIIIAVPLKQSSGRKNETRRAGASAQQRNSLKRKNHRRKHKTKRQKDNTGNLKILNETKRIKYITQ